MDQMHEAVVTAGTRRHRRLAWATVILFSVVYLAILWRLHDRYWYPTDDGFYAHIADRVIAGDVLNKDVQDIHPGYIHVLHVLSFRAFGRDLVALRYPLILAALLQALLSFLFLSRRSAGVALLGTFATAALGVVQFFSPNPNWYCLMLVVALLWWLTSRPVGVPSRLVVAGALLGLLTMLRHLSGAWAAMGLLSIALLERQESSAPGSVWLGRTLSAVMLCGLVGYLILTSVDQPGSLLLFVSWPAALLVRNCLWLRTPTEGARQALLQIAAGGLPVMVPMVGYHAWHGSTAQWLTDIVFAGTAEMHLTFFGGIGWYALLPLAAAHLIVTPSSVADVANGLYWLMLSLAAAVNGVTTLYDLRRDVPVAHLTPGLMAMFFALVSIYLEGPLYLYYSVGVSLMALVWRLDAIRWRALRISGMASFLIIGVVGFAFHAGRSLDRPPLDVLRGRHPVAEPTKSLREFGASLTLPATEVERYERIVRTIRRRIPAGGTLMVLPNDAQFYYLADRHNPTRFYNAALGMQSEAALSQVLGMLEATPPAMVIFRPGDKYQIPAVETVMAAVRRAYVLHSVESGFELYVPGTSVQHDVAPARPPSLGPDRRPEVGVLRLP